MSADPEDTAANASVDDAVSNGAAADSAESDEQLKKLPRILRYSILVNRDESLVRERLRAEIAQVAPDLPLAIRWADENTVGIGLALADELDHQAVVQDKPDLRNLADCIRLITLPVPRAPEYHQDHQRVAKTLLQASRQLPEDIDYELAAEVETFCVGWAVMPAATVIIPLHQSTSAADNARHLGRRLSRWRVEAAELELTKRYEGRENAREVSSARKDATAVRDKETAAIVPPENCLVVCYMGEEALKNPKMKELVGPFKQIINAALPLVLIPPLHEVREKLRFEFPYAEQVIDFALADLVGRRTVRLRPLLLVGEAGGGKSRFARKLGEALGIGVFRTDASRSDGSVFGGTDKRWYSAEPAHPFLAIAQAKHANPLVLIDEIEKAATRADYGRFWDCLLGFLEPETAARYPDPAFQTNLQLSEISYVATANSLDPLPGPLRDRWRVVTFPKPTAGDLDAMLPAITADLADESGLDSRWVEPLTGYEREAVATHWRGGSVRRLRRVVEIVLRARDKSAVRN
jgi:ATP-dependent Lon protease